MSLILINNQSYFTPIALTDSEGLVVLFTGAFAGVVIQSDGAYPIGYYTPEWEIIDNIWKPFEGTITMNFKLPEGHKHHDT